MTTKKKEPKRKAKTTRKRREPTRRKRRVTQPPSEPIAAPQDMPSELPPDEAQLPNAEQPTPKAETPKGFPPGDRPAYKFDAKRKEEYLEKLREGGRRHQSARAVGITPQTVCEHMRKDLEFRHQVMFAEMEADDEVEDALRTAAISGNVTAALAWLYSRQSGRWKDTRHLKFDDPKEVIKDILGKCDENGIDPWADPGLASILSSLGAVPSGEQEDSRPDGAAGAGEQPADGQPEQRPEQPEQQSAAPGAPTDVPGVVVDPSPDQEQGHGES